jgi:hypothetical protein
MSSLGIVRQSTRNVLINVRRWRYQHDGPGQCAEEIPAMDISPWIPNNGANWYTNFDMSLFTFN